MVILHFIQGNLHTTSLAAGHRSLGIVSTLCQVDVEQFQLDCLGAAEFIIIAFDDELFMDVTKNSGGWFQVCLPQHSPIDRTVLMFVQPAGNAGFTKCVLTWLSLNRVLEYLSADAADQLVVDVSNEALQIITHS